MLARVLRGESLSAALPRCKKIIDPSQHGFLSELCYGSLRWYPRIDLYLQVLLKKPIRPKDLEIHALLVAGIYQLAYLKKPAYAVVNESVTATKALKKPWAKDMVNAVLRSFLRKKHHLDEELNSTRAFNTAHPEWFLTALEDAWPNRINEAIIEANNTRAPMVLRVNKKVCSRESYLEKLQAAGIDAKYTLLSPEGIQLEIPIDVDSLPNFENGFVSVQDESAQLAASLLSLKPGHAVLDACSAPGGKTGHIAESQRDLDLLLAIDNDRKRLARVEENLTRLKLNAQILEADALRPDAWWNKKVFDRILLDAPCSGTGVIRRHPDIKLLRRAADLDKLADLQLSLLSRLWPTLKKGGVLLYATCSVLPSENDKVIAAFLKATESACLEPIYTQWGLKTPLGKQLFPTKNKHDGFYYARLRKLTN